MKEDDNDANAADRMGQLKSQIAVLQVEYDGLRQQAIEAGANWTGRYWNVTTSQRQWRRCSVTTVERLLPKALADLVIEIGDQDVVHVRPIKKEADK
jgi:hypothetical protein